MLDSIDKQIILLITRGFTSSYSVWSAMENESKKDKNSKKVLAYVNIHKRTINLSKLGFLEEIKSDLINMHSRRDYKVTLKGIEQVLPYILVYPDEIKNIVQYMNKFKLDKKAFGNMLSNRVASMIKSTNLYLGSTTYLEPLPIDTIQVEQLQRTTFEFNRRLEMIQRTILARPQRSPLLQQQLEEAKARNEPVIVDYNIHQSPERTKQQKQVKQEMINEPEIASSYDTKNLNKLLESKSKSKSVGFNPEGIDSILTKYYEDLHRKLETKNVMSTLQDNGTKIRLSYIHPLKPTDVTRLTKLNIEKMKKTLPQTTETIQYLEKIIKSIDQGKSKQNDDLIQTGQSKPIISQKKKI